MTRGLLTRGGGCTGGRLGRERAAGSPPPHSPLCRNLPSSLPQCPPGLYLLLRLPRYLQNSLVRGRGPRPFLSPNQGWALCLVSQMTYSRSQGQSGIPRFRRQAVQLAAPPAGCPTPPPAPASWPLGPERWRSVPRLCFQQNAAQGPSVSCPQAATSGPTAPGPPASHGLPVFPARARAALTARCRVSDENGFPCLSCRPLPVSRPVGPLLPCDSLDTCGPVSPARGGGAGGPLPALAGLLPSEAQEGDSRPPVSPAGCGRASGSPRGLAWSSSREPGRVG